MPKFNAKQIQCQNWCQAILSSICLILRVRKASYHEVCGPCMGEERGVKREKVQVDFFDNVPRLVSFSILGESLLTKLLSQSPIVAGFGGVSFGRDGGGSCVSFKSLMSSGDWSLQMDGVFGFMANKTGLALIKKSQA